MSTSTNRNIEPFEVNTHSDSSNKSNDTDTIKAQTQISSPTHLTAGQNGLSPAPPSPVSDAEMPPSPQAPQATRRTLLRLERMKEDLDMFTASVTELKMMHFVFAADPDFSSLPLGSLNTVIQRMENNLSSAKRTLNELLSTVSHPVLGLDIEARYARLTHLDNEVGEYFRVVEEDLPQILRELDRLEDIEKNKKRTTMSTPSTTNTRSNQNLEVNNNNDISDTPMTILQDDNLDSFDQSNPALPPPSFLSDE
ncbi:hypothetical protein K457DRAFT_18573 [Linnemannia elongata AG-77]|uniref:Uncharacterized protein n=1 Tax=Linnemannia elongata AG-77 TaxID=1314771 RepID=A0A197K179_9FUNG|nr:hypothetical protein K457DRAFT_18573 [Linnemannia elongata AG-77]